MSRNKLGEIILDLRTFNMANGSRVINSDPEDEEYSSEFAKFTPIVKKLLDEEVSNMKHIIICIKDSYNTNIKVSCNVSKRNQNYSIMGVWEEIQDYGDGIITINALTLTFNTSNDEMKLIRASQTPSS